MEHRSNPASNGLTTNAFSDEMLAAVPELAHTDEELLRAFQENLIREIGAEGASVRYAEALQEGRANARKVILAGLDPSDQERVAREMDIVETMHRFGLALWEDSPLSDSHG